MRLKVNLFQFYIGSKRYIPPRKLRGYIGGKFSEHKLLHNHIEGKLAYQYPVVQYKIIDDLPTVAATGKANKIVYEIFPKMKEVKIDGKNLPVYERRFREYNFSYGSTEEQYKYKFMTPWLPLNQKNYKEYSSMKDFKDKKLELERILIGNILSQAKGLSYWVDNELKVDLDFYSLDDPVYFKGVKFHGFKGTFKVNFQLPEYLGLGKSVSHGFGTIKKIVKD